MGKNVSKMATRRIFAAIEISDEVRRLAADHINAIRLDDRGRSIRWERPEKMHITLKFIAKANDDELKALDDVIGEVGAV